MFRQINVLGNSNAGNIQAKADYTISDHKNKKSSTMSRKSSFGNLLQADNHSNEDTAKHSGTPNTSRTDRLDIKKLAKVYTKTLVGSWIGDTSKDSTNDNDEDYYNNNTIININGTRAEDEDIENKYSFDQKKGHKHSHHNTKLRTSNVNLKYDQDKDINTLRATDDLSTLLKSGSKISVDCNNVLSKNMKSKNEFEFDSETISVGNNASSKEMILTGFPKNVGVNSIVACIFGGRLEKIIPDLQFEGDDMFIRQLYISFINEDDGANFFAFSKTGLFVICGSRISVTKFNKLETEKLLKTQSKRSKNYSNSNGGNHFHLNHDFSRLLSLQSKFREPVESEACRCLILKKVYNKKQKFQPVVTASPDYQYRNYSASRPHCLEFNIKEIKEDFSQFGQILEITPAVSRKLCIVIHYYDIRCAVSAKNEKERSTSKFGDKYSDWVAWYGKDPADKPCIQL